KLPEEEKAVIQGVLSRKSQFVRQSAGTVTDGQVIAANMDVVFIVNSFNHDVNLRRIERYILTTYESNATPVIVMTKTDVVTPEDVVRIIHQVEEVAIGIPVVSISNVTGEGIDTLKRYLVAGQAVALLGSSGVGKSTLINRLMGRTVQQTNDIRDHDSKGRHTTHIVKCSSFQRVRSLWILRECENYTSGKVTNPSTRHSRTLKPLRLTVNSMTVNM